MRALAALAHVGGAAVGVGGAAGAVGQRAPGRIRDAGQAPGARAG